jgi:hypothetical protein
MLPPPGDRLRNSAPVEPVVVIRMPDNGREEVLPLPVEDESGWTYRLPKQALATMDGEVCVKLVADGVEVPSGAVPLLWRGILLVQERASRARRLQSGPQKYRFPARPASLSLSYSKGGRRLRTLGGLYRSYGASGSRSSSDRLEVHGPLQFT